MTKADELREILERLRQIIERLDGLITEMKKRGSL
jgi:SepF-like predicted cell division protein (DUF552 family)